MSWSGPRLGKKKIGKQGSLINFGCGRLWGVFEAREGNVVTKKSPTFSAQAHPAHQLSGEGKVLVFFWVWPFNMHAPYILSADDLGHFFGIL